MPQGNIPTTSKTNMSFKKRHAFSPPVLSYPDFVLNLMEAVRTEAEKDGVLRIRVDNSARSVVCFSSTWQSSIIRENARRVFLQTTLTPEGKYLVIYMEQVMQEDAPTREYDAVTANDIPKNIMRFLRLGHLPD